MPEVVLHKTADPIKVKLIKGQKDSYGWEISVQGDDPDKVITEVDAIDQRLRRDYIKAENNEEK